MKDYHDKIPAELVKEIEEHIEKVRQAIKEDASTTAIKAASDELSTRMQKSEKLCRLNPHPQQHLLQRMLKEGQTLTPKI